MLMILTCKFTSFAFDYADGGKEDQSLSLGNLFIYLYIYLQKKKQKTNRKEK